MPGDRGLPRIGVPAVSRLGTDAAPAELEEPEPAPPERAVDAFAAQYDTDDPRPRLAIVLSYDPGDPLDVALLADLPSGISFAIDPDAPGAAEAARRIRSQDQEVLIGIGGLAGRELPQALDAAINLLPEAVGFVDDAASSIQGNRGALEQVLARMQVSGHGLLAYPRGLNAAERSAERAGLPAATLFRAIGGRAPARGAKDTRPRRLRCGAKR